MKSLLLICLFTSAALGFHPATAMGADYPPYDRPKAYQTVPPEMPAKETLPYDPMPFHTWLQVLATEAIASGISENTVRSALAEVEMDDRVIDRDRTQPENTVTFDTYSANVINNSRIKQGRELVQENAALLNDIFSRYGVPPEVIVALWGIESNYGRNTGGFNIIGSLATLAYEGRRANFFRKELLNALRILDQEHISGSDGLRGSWAGAMGQCQFMPSTFLRHAVDYNGDGHRNIWTDKADVFASIANYLAAEGWDRNVTWGRRVLLTRPIPAGSAGLDNKLTLEQWQGMGVRSANGDPLPALPYQASLVQPDGPDGRSFLVYDNFRALMRWNRSTYFASSVGILADKIKTER
ncbi:MAG: lytic transglycosylase domain-containing protein [Bdellovibrionales bacterium]